MITGNKKQLTKEEFAYIHSDPPEPSTEKIPWLSLCAIGRHGHSLSGNL